MKIYCCTCQINGKIYVGCTKNAVETRWRDHVKHALKGSMYPFHRAIRKHGAESFVVEILQECLSLIEMSDSEVAWIARLNSTNSVVGYNATSGGNNAERTLQTRQRMKLAAARRWNDDAYREKFRAYSKNRTPQHRHNLGVGHGKRVDQLSLNDEFIMTFETMRAAQLATGVVSSSISLCCNGKRIRTAGGFHWRFAECH